VESSTLMTDWSSVKWLWWMSLYLGVGLAIPWIMTRAWAHQHGSPARLTAKQLFARGELGLVGLTLAISVIWKVQTSPYSTATIAVGSILLAVAGIMAVAVWIESHCRQSAEVANDPQRAWRDSLSLATFVFCLAIGVEILLDRLAQVSKP
jgi:hypothetical protein